MANKSELDEAVAGYGHSIISFCSSTIFLQCFVVRDVLISGCDQLHNAGGALFWI